MKNLIIEQIEDMKSRGEDLYSIIEYTDQMLNQFSINEAKDVQEITSHLNLEILDVDRFVKVNDCKEITNPIFYIKPGHPSPDGLLSNEIFGIIQEDRANIYAYINLNKYFINPVCYKAWFKLDSKLKGVIAKTDYYSIDKDGQLIKDPRGSNGIEWLRKNIDKIVFKESENGSIRRDIKVKFLNMNRNNLFINKFLVIPPYYRDTNIQDSAKGSVGVGKINELYRQVLSTAKSINATQEYGFDMSGATDLKLQETLLQIYDWFCGTTNKNISKTETGYGITGKFGILRAANQSKTSDYAARSVITSTELKANKYTDMKASFDKSVIPLSEALACFAPFVQFTVRRFFEREFAGTEQYGVLINGKLVYKELKSPLIQFSDDVVVTQMKRYIKGYNNRFIPVTVETADGEKAYMVFKGSFKPINDNPESIYTRRLTWLDILYQCTVEATRDKMVLISRFPIDSRTNQITTQIEIASTNETEPMYVNNQYYKHYPKFRDEDIGIDTSSSFIDTVNISNLYIGGMGADFDGDTVTVRGVFTDEANQELKEFANSKRNFIGLGGKNIRTTDSDVVQSLYNLTNVLVDDKKKIKLPEF